MGPGPERPCGPGPTWAQGAQGPSAAGGLENNSGCNAGAVAPAVVDSSRLCDTTKTVTLQGPRRAPTAAVPPSGCNAAGVPAAVVDLLVPRALTGLQALAQGASASGIIGSCNAGPRGQLYCHVVDVTQLAQGASSCVTTKMRCYLILVRQLLQHMVLRTSSSKAAARHSTIHNKKW